ncbi:MAG: hypothetical protein QW379_01580 [Thermoplasmata archaeon]
MDGGGLKEPEPASSVAPAIPGLVRPNGGQPAYLSPLEEILAGHLSHSRPGSRLLLTCPYTRILKVDMAVLRVLLGRRRERGIYVSIDRPHSFVQTALRKMGVPLDGLIFIDAVSKLTGMRAEGSMVRFLSSGYSLPLLDDLFSRAYLPEGIQMHFVRLEDLSFVLLDNIVVMLQYTTLEKVRRTVTLLGEAVKKFTDMRALITLDPSVSPELYSIVKGTCDREISLLEAGL